MLYYLLPYFYILFVSLNIFFSKLKIIKTWHLLLIILPALLIILLRGNVGTDTFYYLGLLEDYRNYGESHARYEPGFELLGKVIIKLGFSPRAGLALIGFITTYILCKAYSKSKSQMLLFALLVFPLYYYDFTMNGIRYGLSFSIATLAIDSLYNKKYKNFTIWSIIALSIQYSSLLVIFPFLSTLIKKKYLIFIGILLAVPFFLFPEYFMFITDRIAGKRDAYSESFAPSIFSGLGPLTIVFLMYINFIWFHRKKKYSSLIHIILICEIASFILAKFTYAGLRFQGAFMYTMIVYLKNNTDKLIKLRKYYINHIALSVIGILIFVKNISVKLEDDYTPFLPYKFYWEEKNGMGL